MIKPIQNDCIISIWGEELAHSNGLRKSRHLELLTKIKKVAEHKRLALASGERLLEGEREWLCIICVVLESAMTFWAQLWWEMQWNMRIQLNSTKVGLHQKCSCYLLQNINHALWDPGIQDPWLLESRGQVHCSTPGSWLMLLPRLYEVNVFQVSWTIQ